MNKKVFVYGTLKSTERNNIDNLSGDTILISKATTSLAEFALACLGAFPAACINGTERIEGECWEVDAYTFKILDQIEGYPTFYNRKLAPIELEDGTTDVAWIYYIDNIEDYTHSFNSARLLLNKNTNAKLWMSLDTQCNLIDVLSDQKNSYIPTVA